MIAAMVLLANAVVQQPLPAGPAPDAFPQPADTAALSIVVAQTVDQTDPQSLCPQASCTSLFLATFKTVLEHARNIRVRSVLDFCLVVWSWRSVLPFGLEGWSWRLVLPFGLLVRPGRICLEKILIRSPALERRVCSYFVLDLIRRFRLHSALKSPMIQEMRPPPIGAV